MPTSINILALWPYLIISSLSLCLAQIDCSNCTCHVDSYQAYGPNGASLDCKKALDNNLTSYWITQYYPSPSPLPHNFTLDLQKLYNVTGLSYIPRQDGLNIGNIIDWKITLSADDMDWGRRFFGTWTPNSSIKKFEFGEQIEARWIMLTAYTSEGSPFNRTNAAEIRIFEATSAVTSTASPHAAPSSSAMSQPSHSSDTRDGNPLGNVGTAFTVLGGLAALGTLVWSILRFCVQGRGKIPATISSGRP